MVGIVGLEVLLETDTEPPVELVDDRLTEPLETDEVVPSVMLIVLLEVVIVLREELVRELLMVEVTNVLGVVLKILLLPLERELLLLETVLKVVPRELL